MFIGGAILLKKKMVVHARWYGKLATVLFVLAFASIFFLKQEQRYLSNFIFIVPVTWWLVAYIQYGIQNMLPVLKAESEDPTKKKDS